MSDSFVLSRTEEVNKHLALVLLVPPVSGTQRTLGWEGTYHFPTTERSFGTCSRRCCLSNGIH